MPTTLNRTLASILTLCFALPALADKTIDLMQDGNGKPQIIDKKAGNRKFSWESADYTGATGAKAPYFRLVFPNLSKADLEALVDSSSPAVTDWGGKAELKAVANADQSLYSVEVVFNNSATKNTGYLYEVYMPDPNDPNKEIKMDPRVRPR